MLRFKPEHEEFFEAAAKAGHRQRDVAIAFAVKWPLYNPSTRASMHALEPQTVEKNERVYLERIMGAYKKRRAAFNVAQKTRAADAAAAPVVGTVAAPAPAPVVVLDDATVAAKPAPISDGPSSVLEAVDALLREALQCGAIDVDGMEGVTQLAWFVRTIMNVIKVARSEGTIKASTTSAALVSLRDIARKPAAPPAADSLTESLAALVVNSRGLIDSITTLAASQLAENAARDVTIETQKQYISHLERLAGLGK
jgi:hypothetical protein